MCKAIKTKDDKQVTERKDKVVKARKGNVRMLHYPASGGYCETTVVYSDKFKVQFASSNISDYEMDCDDCMISGSSYLIGHGLMYQVPEKADKGHLIEVVCDKCGKRYLLKPVLHVHYELVGDSDDIDYVPLKELFEGE